MEEYVPAKAERCSDWEPDTPSRFFLARKVITSSSQFLTIQEKEKKLKLGNLPSQNPSLFIIHDPFISQSYYPPVTILTPHPFP